MSTASMTGPLPQSGTFGAVDRDLARLVYRLTADLARPNAVIYWTDLLLSAATGYAALALWLHFGLMPAGIAAAVVAMLSLYRCVSFIHELAHLRGRAPRLFRAAWNALIGVPLLLPSFFYECVHALHHSKAHYGTAGDPEYLPFARARPHHLLAVLPIAALLPLLLVGRFLFVVPLAAVWPPLRSVLVARMSSMMLNPAFRRTDPPRPRRRWLALEIITTVYAWSVTGLIAFGVVPLETAVMALAVWCGISALNKFRALAAHHYESDGEPVEMLGQLLDSTSVPPPAVLPMLWAPVGLRFHALHHFMPHLPYHSLGAAHRRLLAALPADSAYRRTVHRSATALWARLLRRQRQSGRSEGSGPSKTSTKAGAQPGAKACAKAAASVH